MHYSAPEREERNKGEENFFEEIMAVNVTNLKKETDIQISEPQRDANKRTPKRSTSKHILSKMSKVKNKERILKAV